MCSGYGILTRFMCSGYGILTRFNLALEFFNDHIDVDNDPFELNAPIFHDTSLLPKNLCSLLGVKRIFLDPNPRYILGPPFYCPRAKQDFWVTPLASLNICM